MGENLPEATFLITRNRSLRSEETDERWHRLASAYHELAEQESSRYPIHQIANENTVAAAMAGIERQIQQEES